MINDGVLKWSGHHFLWICVKCKELIYMTSARLLYFELGQIYTYSILEVYITIMICDDFNQSSDFEMMHVLYQIGYYIYII